MDLPEEPAPINIKSRFKFFRILAIVFLSLLAIALAIVWLLIIPKLENCLFSDEIVCLRGKKYEKYNWQDVSSAKAYRLKKPLRIKAPFDGWFVYSLYGFVNYQRENMGHTPVLIFSQEDGRKVKLYVEEANLLIGEVATKEKVQKGVTVAEILPGEIEFLDNYSLVQVDLPPR